MYRTILVVDGVEVQRAVVDGSGGTCRDVEGGNGNAYEFAAPQPCPADADGEVAFDTRGLRDGPHAVALSVEDAAGNRTLLGSWDVQTHNAPVVVQAPSLGGDARVGGTLSVANGQWDGAPTGFDQRWLRCDAAGANCSPIAGAAGSAYVPTAADAYRRLVAEVVAGNASGSATARSAASAPVADALGRTSPPTDPGPGDPGPGSPGPGNPGPGNPGPGAPNGPGGGDRTTPGGNPAGGDKAGGGNAPAPGERGGQKGPNGSGASERARVTAVLRRPGGGSARRVRSTTTRRWTLAGRLTDERGRGIDGARLTVAVRVGSGRWRTQATVRTDGSGRFAHTLPPGPSREARVAYAAFAGSRPRTSNTVRIDVLSPLTIALDRRVVGGRGVVTISGRAGGQPVPAGGLLVTLQGYQRNFGWRTFRTVRTSRRGAWRTRYRFRSSSGRFAFRAVVPRQGGYPFVTTTSQPVFVTVS